MSSEWLVSMGPALAPWAAFLAVFCAGLGVVFLAGVWPGTVERRLRQLDGSHAGSIADGGAGKSTGEQREGEFLVRWLEPAGDLILPQQEWRRSDIKRQLVFAGYRQPRAVKLFLGTKLFMVAIFPIIVTAIATVIGDPTALLAPFGILRIAAAAALGFYFPDLALGVLIKRRRQKFVESFPDALDMLVVCVEAGLGLDAALNRVAKELRYSHPGLASELSLIGLEVRAGKTRKEAFQSLAERMEIDQVKNLASIIIQAERYGTSIAKALRNFAEEMRVERIQRAKEKAAKLPVKMIFPIMGFIFPALFLILLGPAVIRILATI